MHTDLSRLQKGRVGAQFWSVYVPASLSPPQAVQATLEQIDVVYRMIDRFPAKLGLALTAQDIVKLHQQGKIASLIGMEEAIPLVTLWQFWRQKCILWGLAI